MFQLRKVYRLFPMDLFRKVERNGKKLLILASLTIQLGNCYAFAHARRNCKLKQTRKKMERLHDLS